MTKYGKVYYWAFIIAALVCFSPSKMIAYGVPYIFLGYFLVKETEVKKILTTCYVLLGILFLSFCFYYSLYGNTVFQNYALTLLTYSSFLPILVINNKKIAQPHLLKKVGAFLSMLFLIQGGWGIMQALYGAVILGKGFDVANGDHVEGTIHPHPEAELAFSNPMFATNMSFIALILIVYHFMYGKSKKYRLYVGCFALVLASVMHVLFLAFGAAFVSYLIFRPEFSPIEKVKATFGRKLRRKITKIAVTIFMVFIVVAPIYFLSTNVQLIESFATKTFMAQTPKAKITIDSFNRIPDQYPLFPVFGFGPGQFTSRASLIGSGNYLGGVDNPQVPPLMQSQINPVAEKILIPYLYESQRKKYLGSTGFPHYSWLSVYSELGALGFLAVVLFTTYLIVNALKRAHKSEVHRLLAFIFSTGLGLLFALGMHENYWEIPQAIFLGVLILKLLYANLMHLERFNDEVYGIIDEQVVKQTSGEKMAPNE